MKKILLFAVVAATMMATSCGTSKKTTATVDPAYQQYLAEQEALKTNQETIQEIVSNRTEVQTAGLKRTARTANPCLLKSIEPSESFRAVGIARSFNETSLVTTALNNAQITLAQMLEAAVSGAIKVYNQDATSGNKLSSESVTESVMPTYLNQKIKNTKIIDTYIEDLSDGSIQMYVCVEMGDKKEDVLAGITNTLDNKEVLKVQFDRERFEKNISDGYEKYVNEQANK